MIKKLLKKLVDPQFMRRLPSAIKYRLNRVFHEKILFRLASKENVFASIWRNNYWVSGKACLARDQALNKLRVRL